jgi:hypothetical protein
MPRDSMVTQMNTNLKFYKYMSSIYQIMFPYQTGLILYANDDIQYKTTAH